MAFNFTPFPNLFTERLHLRQLRKEDDQEIFLIRSNDIVNKYLGRAKATCIEDAQHFIEKINAGIKDNQCIYWAICLQQEDQLIGTICLWNISTEHNKAEVGYELLPHYHGKGIMQEAIKKVLDFGFNTMQLKLIEACPIAQNQPSIKVVERNGFKRDHELESNIDRSIESPDLVIYSLRNSTFNSQFSS